MRTQEITHDRWPWFFDDFTQIHHGEHVNVETLAAGGSEVRSQLCDLPLAGIVPADANSGPEWIEIIAGEAPQTQATCAVASPSRVVVAQEGGHDIALQIESVDGSVTMLRFQPPREGMPAGYTIS